MTSSNNWLLLGTLLSVTAAGGASAQAVDTSKWTCESCPYEKGVKGTVDVGAQYVSESSARFGTYTGLNQSGAYFVGAADLTYRSDDRLWADLLVVDLTPDAIQFGARGGQEGVFALRLGYNEIPRYYTDTALTPFLGSGGTTLTLPGGFPAATTGAMPLAASLEPADLSYKRSRLDLGAAWLGTESWIFDVSGSHLKREGTQRGSGSFFSTASALVKPVDQTTDEVEAKATYSHNELQATVAYRLSLFRNSADSLTWTNPFSDLVVGGQALGATRGQLALAPDNDFHQLQATVGYQLSPTSRASADIAVGRMTQDAAYLPSTLNSNLSAAVGPLPATSLNGTANTLNAALRYSAEPIEKLRLTASVARNERDNNTSSYAYPSVSTDMFVGPSYTNVPYSFTQNQAKIGVDYRGPGTLRLATGINYEEVDRPAQEADHSRKTSLYARLAMQPAKSIGLTFKAAVSENRPGSYETVSTIDPAQNPLLRKYNMARSRRSGGGVRADWAISETVNLGVDADIQYDDYPDTQIGLTNADTRGLGFDLSVAFAEASQFQFFARTDRLHSRQAGSQQYSTPDWAAATSDTADVVGVGLRHAAIKDKLDIGADIAYSRANSNVGVNTGASDAPFPTNSSTFESLKLFATYKLTGNVSLTGSYWYEHYSSRDWHLDGVQPATIPNYLAFGEQSPRYNVNVFRVAARYKF